MRPTAEEIAAGQAFYTDSTLPNYDFRVLRLSNPLIWRCPTERLLDFFNAHVSDNHLDIGVGSGYYLDHCAFPSQHPRLALMDLNMMALAYAARRIARYRPATYRRNVLEPIDLAAPGFDSISLNYLLHCLPGPMASKAVVFDHIKPLMNPGAICFGATLLQGGVRRSWTAKLLMAHYNRHGVFSNRQDDVEALERALRTRFSFISIEIVGCAAFFPRASEQESRRTTPKMCRNGHTCRKSSLACANHANSSCDFEASFTMITSRRSWSAAR